MIAFHPMNRLGCLLWATLAIGCSAGDDGAPPSMPSPSTDARVDSKPPDAAADARKDATAPPGDSTAVDDSSPLDTAPPLQDVSWIEDFGLPPVGSRIEGVLGPDGGTLSGTAGSPLAGVSLVVPKGALSTSIAFAIDLVAAPGAPLGGKLVSPYVRVGPEGVAFAVPASLTLPWSSTDGNPQLAAVARIGYTWSSLLSPSGDGKTVTASMRRSSAAAIAQLDLTALAPKITAASVAGSTLFVDGAGFGVAQVFRPGGDGGAPFVSKVTVDGLVAEPIAWSDTAISLRLEADAGAPTTTIVTTPGGSATAP